MATRPRTKRPTTRQIGLWKESIARDGVATVTSKRLRTLFGQDRRTTALTRRIEKFLLRHGLYMDSFEFWDADGWETGRTKPRVRKREGVISLADHPFHRVGYPAEKEEHIEARLDAEVLPALNAAFRLELTPVSTAHPRDEYSPAGTRDRMDRLCTDGAGRGVVVELKRETGDKRVVEQVMRYIGHLKAEGKYPEPRGVIITAVADPHTRRALEGRERDSHIDWYVYGLRGAEPGTIKFDAVVVERADSD